MISHRVYHYIGKIYTNNPKQTELEASVEQSRAKAYYNSVLPYYGKAISKTDTANRKPTVQA